MSEPGFASLSPTLLARKGGAKPAMRPQLAPLTQVAANVSDEQLEDLGWNDMDGHESDAGANAGADIVPINPDISTDSSAPAHGPIVRRQQHRLEERVLADAAMNGPQDSDPDYDFEDEEYAPDQPRLAQVAVLAAAAPKPRAPVAAAVRRAAFTLRLDAERHLKLRLAATMQNVSAQVLVTEALDRLLAEIDELDVIAKHLKRH